MTKVIKNVTGEDPRFPRKQILAYKEAGKGNQSELIKLNAAKFSSYVLIGPGEEIETKLNGENVYGEARLKFIDSKKEAKK